MRLDDERDSSNVDDERGAGLGGSGGGGFGGGGFGGAPLRIGGIGAIVIVVGGLLLGVSPQTIFALLSGGSVGGGQVQPQSQPQAQPRQMQRQDQADAGQDSQRQFVGRILASTEDVWSQQFQAHGRTYHDPKLVLFSGAYPSGCGTAETATGPFYCPMDGKVYLDLDFFRELQGRLGAGGDFARAYVIAHEVGHHVQDELGLMAKTAEQRHELDEVGRNALSVKVELQADCYAGVWANHANTKLQLNDTDIQQAVNAAAAVGDDRLQRMSRGTVSPDSFTHGSSAQRSAWFSRGYKSGEIGSCDTFAQQ